MPTPDVLGYDDYRPFLKEWFRVHKRNTGRKGTSDFSRLAGCTPGHVRNVVTGRRNLQPSLVSGFSRALGLDGDRATFFTLLVRNAHPISAADRLQAAREIKTLRERHGAPEAPTAAPRGRPRKGAAPELPRYADWFHPVIRALLACPAAKADPAWVAECLRPAVSPLVVAPLLKDRRPLEAQGVVVVPSPIDEPNLRAYHKDVLSIARWGLHKVAPQERQYRSNIISIPAALFPRLQAEIMAWQKEMEDLFARAQQGLIERVAAPDPNPDRPDVVDLRHGAPNMVYQLAIQVFPLSR